MSDLAELLERLDTSLPTLVSESKMVYGELTVTVTPDHLVNVLSWLQWQGDFKILVDVCGVDWPQARSALTSSTICCR